MKALLQLYFSIFMHRIRFFSYFVANFKLSLNIKIAVMKAKLYFFLLSRIFLLSCDSNT